MSQPTTEPRPETMLEFTVRAVLLGVVVGLLMTCANVYLGLYAGMTVSASIPAAVISMGILRGLMRTGTIRENNIVQTIGSAGESLAAGIIFTVPALVILGVWENFEFWPTTLIALLGGLLGVVFMIPIRRALIVEEKELTYPEGVACAEVLRAGERQGSGILYIAAALCVGAVVKFLSTGLKLIHGEIVLATRVGKTGLFFGCDISPALLAVGYIVGMNVAALVFLGGALGWLVGIPLYYLAAGGPDPAMPIADAMYETWSTQIRYMGVGAMIVGGLWSIFTVRHGIVKGVSGVVHAFANKDDGSTDRTDTDMPLPAILAVFVPTVIGVFVLYALLTKSLAIGATAGLIMIVAAFFFVAVSSYIVGLVGSSNNPVSGMTISTILLACLLLTVFQMTGTPGIIASLGIAGVVCCAACTAGDVSQDLKTGQLVGATPYKQQWGQVIGVLTSAFVIAPILMLLHSSYGVGVAPPRAEAPTTEYVVQEVEAEDVEILEAPQANLFANIAKAFFMKDGSLPWTMVAIGAGIGIVLIVLDTYLKSIGSGFRTYVMPVAVGIYLPWSLGVPIFLGGIAAAVTHKLAPGDEQRKTEAVHRGVLVGAGLIAGEAVMGILMAVMIISLSKAQLAAMQIDLGDTVETILSVVVLLIVFAGLLFAGLVGRKDDKE